MTKSLESLVPSTRPALTAAEIDDLPPGMVLVTGDAPHAIRLDQRRDDEWAVDLWQRRQWSRHRFWSSSDLAAIRGGIHLPRLPRVTCRLTAEQVRRRGKTVSRRVWRRGAGPGKPGQPVVRFEPADLLLLVERGRVSRAPALGVVAVVSAELEPLRAIADRREDLAAEGFPELTPDEFVAMFVAAHRGRRDEAIGPETIVTRLQWSFDLDHACGFCDAVWIAGPGPGAQCAACEWPADAVETIRHDGAWRRFLRNLDGCGCPAPSEILSYAALPPDERRRDSQIQDHLALCGSCTNAFFAAREENPDAGHPHLPSLR